MNIVFFSTNSNDFNENSLNIQTFPSWKSQWLELGKKHQEHSFFVITQLPGMFLIDSKQDCDEKISNIKFILSKKTKIQEIADEILEIKPDLAIATTFYVTPFDWLTVEDALVAEILRKNGVKTICNSAKTGMICFNKEMTQNFLEKNGFNTPKSLYVHHEMFWYERSRHEIHTNVYKEYILNEVKNLNFPVIAKDTVGLSSYGMEVLPTYKSVVGYLLSHKNSSDRILQEFIEGEQFGCEIYGIKDDYEVFPPCIFSVNKFGITSPKQSIKLGPITQEKYHIEELQNELKRLAKLLQIEGFAQVDLVFSKGKWFIIEINPRLSGMSTLYSSSLNKSLYEMIFDVSQGKKLSTQNNDFLKVCNFKLPLLSSEQLEKLKNLSFIRFIHQIENLEAKQNRERGYCEIILGGTKTIEETMQKLHELSVIFPEIIEKKFYENAKKIENNTKTL